MRKMIVLIGMKVIIFLYIFIYFFIHISYMVRPELSHTRNNLSGFYDEEKDSLDVVFVGSSGTFSAFAPMTAWEEYGFSSYNLCTNVMCAETVSYAVKEALKYQSPKVLVIDIYPFILRHTLREREESQLRFNTDGWRFSLERLFFIKDEIPQNMDKASFYFDLIRYHSNYANFNWNNWNGSYHNGNKGYNFLPWEAAEPAVMTEEIVKIPEEYDTTLDDLLAYCKEIDTEVLFIYYPFGKRGASYSDIGNLNYCQKKIEDMGFSFLNCELIWEQFALDYDRDYWGSIHFNIYGAEKVTKVVGKYLQTAYQLEDKREDEGYASWNEDLKIWNENLAARKNEVDVARNQALNQ